MSKVQASKLKATMKKQEDKISVLEQQVEDMFHELNLPVAADAIICPQLRDSEKNRFSDRVRQTVIALQGDANVPATKCNFVIC